MSIDDYLKQCKRIHAALHDIAKQTHDMARAKCADPSNSRFVDLINRQLALFAELEDLDKQMLSS